MLWCWCICDFEQTMCAKMQELSVALEQWLLSFLGVPVFQPLCQRSCQQDFLIFTPCLLPWPKLKPSWNFRKSAHWGEKQSHKKKVNTNVHLLYCSVECGGGTQHSSTPQHKSIACIQSADSARTHFEAAHTLSEGASWSVHCFLLSLISQPHG